MVDVSIAQPNGTTGRMTPGMLDLANAAYGGHGPMAHPDCTICGETNVEDAGDHADQTGHWPTAD